ncbi:MAG: hypothetical protein RLZZ507_3727 [Cyanobacteriota bacterium]|jgi:hypothetical protein
MKSIPLTAFIVSGLITASSLPTLAAGSNTYRSIKSNNILPCPTNQQIEQTWSGGDVSHYGSEHLIICLESNRKAKWVMYSYRTCQPHKVEPQNCPDIQTNSFEEKDNTYIFKPQKTGIGTNCKIVKATGEYNTIYYHWTCEKYTARQNLTIITKGNEPLLSSGRLYDQYGSMPAKFQLNTSDHPECKNSSSMCKQDYPGLGGDGKKLDSRLYIDCRGDAEFCNWKYK